MKPPYRGILWITVGLIAVASMMIPTGVHAHIGRARGKTVFPNPFSQGTTFELTMPREAKIKIDVYNIRGQHIKNLLGGDEGIEQSAGEYPIVWDGKDKFGVPVVQGVYICVLRAEGITIKSVKAIKLIQ